MTFNNIFFLLEFCHIIAKYPPHCYLIIWGKKNGIAILIYWLHNIKEYFTTVRSSTSIVCCLCITWWHWCPSFKFNSIFIITNEIQMFLCAW